MNKETRVILRALQILLVGDARSGPAVETYDEIGEMLDPTKSKDIPYEKSLEELRESL